MSKDGSGNLLGPNLTLDIDCILEDFDKNERDQEFKQVTFVLLRNVSVLRRIYNFYSALGHRRDGTSAVGMTKLQFWRFLKDCGIHHHNNASLSSMDRVIAKNKDIEDIHNPLEKIQLKDFHSNCVILSYFIYQKKESSSGKKSGIIAKCLQRLIDEHIAKFSGQVHGQFLSEPRRAMSALAYMERSWEIYQSVCTTRRLPPFENSFCMRQFLFLLKDLKIVGPRLSTKDVLNILSSDDPSVSDGDNYNLELEMTFLEFFEALIGIAIKFKSSDHPPLEQHLPLTSSRSQKAKNRASHSETSPPATQRSTSSNKSIKEKTEEIKRKLSNSVQQQSFREDELHVWYIKLNKFFTQFFFPAWNHAETLRNKVAKDKAEKELRRLRNEDTESETSDSLEQESRPIVSYTGEKSWASSASSYEPSLFTESEFGTFAPSTPGLSRVSSSVSSSVSRRTNNAPFAPSTPGLSRVSSSVSSSVSRTNNASSN